MVSKIDLSAVNGLEAQIEALNTAMAGVVDDAEDAIAAAIAGLPAGYTVETGTDATNGEWEKHPSGLLICRKNISLGASSTLGAPINASAAVAWTFPVPFVGMLPTVYASGSAHWYGTTSVSLTAASVRYFFVTSTSAGPVPAYATAIGRWK